MENKKIVESYNDFHKINENEENNIEKIYFINGTLMEGVHGDTLEDTARWFAKKVHSGLNLTKVEIAEETNMISPTIILTIKGTEEQHLKYYDSKKMYSDSSMRHWEARTDSISVWSKEDYMKFKQEEEVKEIKL